ncbi:MAG: hypothetical protein JWO08_2362 [Verrucomicrobiaceae bacterium]|nr:hypothetical protein [Verrucomicrobiaceae bacterium]
MASCNCPCHGGGSLLLRSFALGDGGAGIEDGGGEVVLDAAEVEEANVHGEAGGGLLVALELAGGVLQLLILLDGDADGEGSGVAHGNERQY